jgi:hypothetical protein
MMTSSSMEDELPQTTTTQQDHDPNGAPPGLADIAAICAASEKLRYGIMSLDVIMSRLSHKAQAQLQATRTLGRLLSV